MLLLSKDYENIKKMESSSYIWNIQGKTVTMAVNDDARHMPAEGGTCRGLRLLRVCAVAGEMYRF